MASLAYSDYNDSSSINNMENKNKKITRHNTTIKKRVDTSNNENVKNMLKIINNSNGYDNDNDNDNDGSGLADFNPPPRAQISTTKMIENTEQDITSSTPNVKDINIDYEKPTTIENNQADMEMDNSVMEVKPRHNPAPLDSYEGFNSLPKHYASDYYKQYVPYFNQNGGSNNTTMNKGQLLEKLNYMIHLLEDQKDEKTGHVMEEVILYSFLGVFIIFIVDSFARVGKYTR